MPRHKWSSAKKLGQAIDEKTNIGETWNATAEKIAKKTQEAISKGVQKAKEIAKEAYEEVTGQNSAQRANEQTSEWIDKILAYNELQAESANSQTWRMLEAQMRYNSAQAAQANEFSQKMWNETAAYNSAQAEANRQFSAEEAAKDRLWQEQMSSTAHQREIEDLRAAGLNPILSVTGGNGAAMGQGAMGQTMAASTGAISGQGIAAGIAQAQKASANIVSAAMENSSNALALFGNIFDKLLPNKSQLVKIIKK